MGKVKHQKKARVAREDAFRAPLTGVKREKERDTQTAFASLKSAVVSERLNAAANLATHVCELPEAQLRPILSQNLVATLILQINDSDERVGLECLRALRNLAVSSTSEVLSEIANKRVLVPLTAKHIPRLMSLIQRIEKLSPQQKQLLCDWNDNILTLLWAFAESSRKILNMLNQHLPLLWEYAMLIVRDTALIKSGLVPLNCVTVALHFLSAVANGNDAADDLVVKNLQAFDALLSADVKESSGPIASVSSVSFAWELAKLLCVGILSQYASVAEGSALKEASSLVRPRLPLLVRVVSHVNLDEALVLWSSEKSQITSQPQAQAEDALTNAQIALEVLAQWFTFCGSSYAGKSPEEAWAGPIDHMQLDDDSGDDMDVADAVDQPLVSQKEKITCAQIASKTFPQLVNLTQDYSGKIGEFRQAAGLLLSTDTSGAVQQESAGPAASFADLVVSVQERALECVNNLLMTLLSMDLRLDVEPEVVSHAWIQTLHWLDTAKDTEVQSAAVGVMWGLAKVAPELGAELAEPARVSSKLIELARARSSDVSTNSEDAIVRALGVLGVLAVRPGVSLEENAAIGHLFLDLLRTPVTADIVVQAVEVFIDIYADETQHHDAVFRNQDFLTRLKHAHEPLRQAYRKVDKKRFPELKQRFGVALQNYAAFVEYRESL